MNFFRIIFFYLARIKSDRISCKPIKLDSIQDIPPIYVYLKKSGLLYTEIFRQWLLMYKTIFNNWLICRTERWKQPIFWWTRHKQDENVHHNSSTIFLHIVFPKKMKCEGNFQKHLFNLCIILYPTKNRFLQSSLQNLILPSFILFLLCSWVNFFSYYLLHYIPITLHTLHYLLHTYYLRS